MSIAGLSLVDLSLVGGTLCFAYLIRGIAGFGSALIAVPLLALRYPLALVVPVITLLDWFAAIAQGVKLRRQIRWPDLLPLLPFSALGVFSALFLHKIVAAADLAMALGIFVICYGAYALLPLPQLRGGRGWSAPAGFLGGMVGGVFGTGGPFYVIYLTLRQLNKEEFRTTVATIFVMDGFFRLLGFAAGGFYNRQVLTFVLLALPLMGAGLWVGGRIHLSMSQQGFVRLVSFILFGSGLALLSKSF